LTDFKFTDLAEKRSALVRYAGQTAEALLEALSKEGQSGSDPDSQFLTSLKSAEDPKSVP